MTRAEYHKLAPRYNKADKLIAQIPLNINRAGKHYQKLIKQIYGDSTLKTNRTTCRKS